MARILVTGGLGFMGSNFTRYLVERHPDEEIAVFDALTHAGRIENISGIERKLTLIVKDLRDEKAVDKAVRDSDVVYHLAAETHIDRSIPDPAPFIESNVLGTFNLLEAARKHGVERLVYVSSSEIYGTALTAPMDESHPLNPQSPYAATKVASDRMCYAYHATYGLPVVILRPFNCYSADTEVLTDEGFKPFSQLNGSELIATLNPRTNELEYQRPLAYISYFHSGRMVRIRGKEIDLLVTRDHNVWCRKRWQRSFEFMDAGSLLWYRGKRAVAFQLWCNWRGTNRNVFKLPKMEQGYERGRFLPKEFTGEYYAFDVRDWTKFLAWYLAEGSVYDDPKNGHYAISIRQKKERYISEIANLVSKLDFNPSVARGSNGRIRIYNRELYLYLRRFGNSRDRFIPSFIKELPSDLIYEFLYTYAKADGTTRNGRIVALCSYSPQMIDDLQELCLKAGLVATRTNPHQFLTVSYTRGEVVPRGENNFSEEKYSGMVYCVSVPNRIILVRRNGKMAWCGNCYGPRQFPEKLIPFFTLRALHGLFLPIYGDGQYSRDYTYVMDFCEACDLAMRVKPRGEAINIATGRDVKVIDIARMILGHLGKPEALIRHVKDRPGHVRRLVGDYTRAKEIMGWRPRTSFEEGLRKTIDWYINNEWWWRPLSSQFMKVALPWERPRPRR